MQRVIKAVLLVLAISALLSIPAGGFAFGCISPAPISGGGGSLLHVLFARLFFGLSFAWQTTIAFGFPSPDASRGIAPLNTWPYIFAMFFPVFFTTLFVAWMLGVFAKNRWRSIGAHGLGRDRAK